MPQDSYRTIIEKIARTKSSNVTVFSDFCRIAACALSAGAREDEYFETIRPYSKEELSFLTKAFALFIQEAEEKPFTDVLGQYYLEIAGHSSKQARGEFYTPDSICELMTRITMDAKKVIKVGNPVSMLEPACGAGGMVLATAKQFSPIMRDDEKSYVDLLRVTCQDINPVATDMTFINTTLWGIPAKIQLGNFLSKELSDKTWKNIHWQRVGEDGRIKSLALLRKFQAMEETRSNPPEERQPVTTPPLDKDLDQVEFDFNLGAVSQRAR